MHTVAFKKHFLRNKNIVSNRYIYKEEEIRENGRMKILFDRFDEDGSGALDAREISELYKENDMDVSVEMIKKLFGDDVYLTLENFIKFSRSKEDLARYYHAFKEM